MTIKHKTWCLLGLTFGPPITAVVLALLFCYAGMDKLPTSKLEMRVVWHSIFD